MKDLFNSLYDKSKKWILIERDEFKYLKSDCLSKIGFNHAFLTKSCEKQNAFEKLGIENEKLTISSLIQVHGNKIIKASDCKKEYKIKADGLISTTKDESLWIYTADCIPVLIADKITGRVSACHVGWRGINNGIILKAIAELEAKGSKRRNLLIVMGPSIRGVNYQVKEELVEIINHSIINSINIYTKKDTEVSIKYNQYYIKDLNNPGHVWLDIKLAARMQLISIGFDSNQINICPFCTFANPKLFNSWRREKERKYQWTFIISQG